MAKRKKSGQPDSVGWGRPPRHTQFRPGTSGNPNGRPRGSKNFASVVKKVLSRRVKVTQGGSDKKMPTQEAFANLIAMRALAGDSKATGYLIRLVDLVDRESSDTVAHEQQPVRPEDELVMTSIVRRIRAMDESLGEDDANPKNAGDPEKPKDKE